MIKKYFFIISLLICIASCNDYPELSIKTSKFTFGPFIDSKIIIKNNSSIIFSRGDGNNFRIMKYRSGISTKLFGGEKDYFNPFIAKGKTCALSDSLGTAEFKPSTEILDFFLSKFGTTIDKIYSSKSGNYVVILLNQNNAIYLVDLKSRKFNMLGIVSEKLNSAVFSKDDKFLILSYDSHLLYYSIEKNKSVELVKNIITPKLNPSIDNNEIYFVMNNNSEYYQIYKIKLNDLSSSPVLIKNSNHDLRLPKVWENYLYFITIIKSEYLLVRENLITHNEEFLTTKGVVYNYEFFDKNKLAIIYSDFITPRNVFIYNLKTKKMDNIGGKSINLNIKYTFICKDKNLSDGLQDLSPAYIFEPKDHLFNKGVILFFHPGLHKDFSPRWDNILMNLTNNGYVIIAPNYPMSSGYGKFYQNQSIDLTVNDIQKWLKYIKRKYSYPLYFISSSSGNIIMETVLNETNYEVKAAVSIFGIPGTGISGTSTPVLYILGKNDPLVEYKSRLFALKKEAVEGCNIKIKTFTDEGHWFRKASNIRTSIDLINAFFINNRE